MDFILDFDLLINGGLSFFDMIKPPIDISTNGHLIDWLFNYVTIMVTFFFILVCIGLFGFSYFYSAKRHPKPYYTYGNKKRHVQVALVIGIAVFVLVDMTIARTSNNDLLNVFFKFPKGEEVIRVEIMAQQWMWKIRYAGKDGIFNTEDDVITTNDLRLPINKKVVVQLTSKDVIHSFFLPNVRLKTDAIPGRITRLWFELTTPGDYEIACAEMCGTHHYLMRGEMKVYSEEDFDEWLETAQELASYENDPTDLDRFWGWKWEE